MANFVYNVALGTIAEKVRDGATLRMVVLQVANTDDILKDLTTLQAVLTSGSTDEADFTNYVRPTLANMTAVANHTDNDVDFDFDDIVLATAGGAVNNTTTDVVIYEEVAGGDSNCIPLLQLDAIFTTNGSDVTLTIPAGGIWRSTQA